MKKVVKVVGIIIGIVVVLFIIVRLDNLRVRRLEKEADIYIEHNYVGKGTLGIEEFAVVNIEKNKLYIIKSILNHGVINIVKSKNITDTEINELINLFENTTVNSAPFMKWRVKYRNITKELEELPFEIF